MPLVSPVLDIGCGDGHFASIAYDQLPIDVGIDVMARDLREAATRRGVYRQVMYASATELPYADAAFNTVISNCVIEHIPDNDAVLAEISACCAPAASSPPRCPASTTPNICSAQRPFAAGLPSLGHAYGRFFNRISHHYHVYSPEVWRERLSAAGFVVEEQTYYFSAAAHRRFDLSHYLGVPNLVTKRLFGRWVICDGQMRLFERWLRPYYEEPLPDRARISSCNAGGCLDEIHVAKGSASRF